MKKTILILVLTLVLYFPLLAFAQVARIIDLGGQVSVKNDASIEWKKAKINMLLNRDAELQTGNDSYCTLAFDEEQRNIVTIKQNSYIKIDSVKPGSISLPKGRVFSLIDNLSKNEKFQIRTPTAIAGARGTGWVTDYNGKDTSAKCFKDTIYVQGLDGQGKVRGEKDLFSGTGMNVGSGGIFGDIYNLSDTDNREWNDFSGYLSDLTGEDRQKDSGSNRGALEDLRQEQRDDSREEFGQQRRQENTTTSASPGGQQQR